MLIIRQASGDIRLATQIAVVCYTPAVFSPVEHRSPHDKSSGEKGGFFFPRDMLGGDISYIHTYTYKYMYTILIYNVRVGLRAS